MNEALANASLILFLLSAPVLLTARAWKPHRMPWWLVVLLAAAIAWMLLNVCTFFVNRYQAEQDKLLNPFALADYARNDRALLWGWIAGIVYLALWLVPYGLGCALRRRWSRQSSTA